MAPGKIKDCPRCGKGFECRPGNIVQCGCFNIHLNGEQKAYVEGRYEGCLCLDCLLCLPAEVNLFKEKYIFCK